MNRFKKDEKVEWLSDTNLEKKLYGMAKYEFLSAISQGILHYFGVR